MPNFPSNPYVGQIVASGGKYYQWTGQQWVVLIYPPPPPDVKVSSSPPSNPSVGNLWFSTLNKSLYVYVSGPGGGTWELSVNVEESPEVPPVTVSASAPNNPSIGNLWYDTIQYLLKVYVNRAGTELWEPIFDQSSTEEPPVKVSASAPVNPIQGELWFNTLNNTLYVFMDTLGGGYWEATSNATPPAEQSPATVSSSPPINPLQGDLWFNPTSLQFRVFVGSDSTGRWESAVFDSPETEPPVAVSASPPTSPVQGSLWYDTINSLLKIYKNVLGGASYWEEIQASTPETPNPPVIISVSPPPGAEPGTLWFDTSTGLFNLRIQNLGGGDQWICPTQGPPGPVGPQGEAGPPGPIVSSLTQLIDVDTVEQTDRSIMYYDAASSSYKFDPSVTVPNIADGGN